MVSSSLRNNRPARIMLGICFICLAFFGAYNAMRIYKLAKNSEHWPLTMGKVIDQHIDVASTRGGGLEYRPRIKYCYTVDGRTHVSSTIRNPPIDFNSRQEANKFVSKYQENSQIVVYYDPENPKFACLEMSYLENPDKAREYITVSTTIFFGFVVMGTILISRIGINKPLA